MRRKSQENCGGPSSAPLTHIPSPLSLQTSHLSLCAGHIVPSVAGASKGQRCDVFMGDSSRNFEPLRTLLQHVFPSPMGKSSLLLRSKQNAFQANGYKRDPIGVLPSYYVTVLACPFRKPFCSFPALELLGTMLSRRLQISPAMFISLSTFPCYLISYWRYQDLDLGPDANALLQCKRSFSFMVYQFRLPCCHLLDS